MSDKATIIFNGLDNNSLKEKIVIKADSLNQNSFKTLVEGEQYDLTRNELDQLPTSSYTIITPFPPSSGDGGGSTSGEVIVTNQISGFALDGKDATSVTPPTGGSGIRGWLSGIYNLLFNGSAKVTIQGTPNVTVTNPVSTVTIANPTTSVSVSSIPALPTGSNTIGNVGINGTPNVKMTGANTTGVKAVTPNDTTDLVGGNCIGIYIGYPGNLTIINPDGTEVLISNLAAGVVYPFPAKRIKATGTTASGILAVY